MLTSIQPHNAGRNIAFQSKVVSQTISRMPRKTRQNTVTIAQPQKETFADIVKNILGEMFPSLDPEYKKLFNNVSKIK